jgi:hypothetical protein
VKVSITGATPNVGVDIDVFSPGGQQVVATFIRADSQGGAVDRFSWPPASSASPSPGAWKVTVYDTATGAGVIEYLQVE